MLLSATACATPGFVRAPTPATPADVEFLIPSGTDAALERGEPAFQFPDEILVQAGQSIIITNDDHAMHYFFDFRSLRVKRFASPSHALVNSFTRVA